MYSMRRLNPRNRRQGAALIEYALVLPILILLVSGLIILGLGVFRYQQLATLAREGARYASVRGAQYQTESGKSAASADDVYTNAILPLAIGLDLDNLTHTVTWSDSAKAPTVADPTSNPPGQPLGTTVTVTVTYTWGGLPYWGGLTLTSTSVMPMQY